MTGIQLTNLTKRFDSTSAPALRDVSLEIEPGELFFLLGPSGCGKSTLLRLIAGLLEPTSGQISFNGLDVTRVGTQHRNAVMCFQSYALWPHMTVMQNVRFGLSVRNLSETDQKKRAAEALAMVRMESYADRRPAQLSGGQQQRVALARALAVHPACLLLDEPLSNLDAKLRLEMRSEIRRICKSAGFTTIYVTHDQKEALSVADRLAVLKDGQLIQAGPPRDLYHRPASSFVADFLGQTNLVKGSVAGRDGPSWQVNTPMGLLLCAASTQLSGDCLVSIRPESIRLRSITLADRAAANRFTGIVLESTFLGEFSEHVVEINGEKLKFTSSAPGIKTSAPVSIEFDAADALALAS